jgi:voltage-gated potassium channel Kch
VTLVGILTIGASTYMILYSGPLYERLAPLLRIFEFRAPFRETDAVSEPLGAKVAVIGLGRFGRAIVLALRERGVEPIALDFDPSEVKRAREHGVAALYADAEDPEFVDQLPLASLRWVICTPADASIGSMLIHELRERGYTGAIGVTAHFEAHAERFKGAPHGVIVLRPFESAGDSVASEIAASLTGQPDMASQPPPER